MIHVLLAEFKDRELENKFLTHALNKNLLVSMLVYIGLSIPNLFLLFQIFLVHGFSDIFATHSLLNTSFFLVILLSCRNFLGDRDPMLMHRLHLLIWIIFALIHFGPWSSVAGLGPLTLIFVPVYVVTVHFLLPLTMTHIYLTMFGLLLLTYYDIYIVNRSYFLISPSAFWVLFSLTFLICAIGRLLSSTNRRNLFASLIKEREAAKEKEELFAILAHDLRAPINTQAQILRLANMFWDIKSPQEIHDLVLKVGGSTEHMSRLIDNMLGWSRLQKDLLALYYENIDIYSLFKECSEIMQLSLQQKEIKLELPPKERKVTAHVDVNLLRTILLNLLNNAIKYSKPKSTIYLQFRDTSSETFISVSDKGMGIEKETIAKLLSGQNKSSVSGSQGETGTGLGLRVSYQYLQKMNGRIEIESEIRHGTTIKIYLPKKSL